MVFQFVLSFRIGHTNWRLQELSARDQVRSDLINVSGSKDHVRQESSVSDFLPYRIVEMN